MSFELSAMSRQYVRRGRLGFAMLVLFMLAACQNTGPSAVPEIHTGTQGLVMRFLDKAPPEVLYPERPFQIALDLH